MNNWIAVILAVIVLIIICFLVFDGYIRPGSKITKADLARLYGIEIKTFNKWISHYTDIPVEEWKKMRKIDWATYCKIEAVLGVPVLEPSYTKQALRDELKASYYTFTECCKKGADKLGIAYESIKKMDVFPPRVAGALIDHMAV